MRIPAIKGIIDRRILVNFRIDPDVMAAALPEPFKPQLYDGWAVGGICLIRLKKIRPKMSPLPFGLSSENAAHRIAVEWEADGERKQGVYIPRRDTDSRLSSFAGGRIFPGEHHLAVFTVEENDPEYAVGMLSADTKTSVSVKGEVTDQLPSFSIFKSLDDVSAFFEQGSVGYSATKKDGVYDGLELQCKDWQVHALNVVGVTSSYFEDQKVFPAGSVHFDNALLMKNIHHEWHSLENICCSMNG